MTTEAAERAYQAEHLREWGGKGYAVYNPRGRDIADLPVIYGFNNGGGPGSYRAVLLAEDGTALGGHGCSHECYMPHDLGVSVGAADVKAHEGLASAYQANQRKRAEAEEAS